MNTTTRVHTILTRLRSDWSLPSAISAKLPWAVLFIALSVTTLLWKNTRNQLTREAENEFHFRAQEAQKIIENRINVYKLILNGASGLFASSSNVTRDEFRRYVRSLDLEKKYPGVKELGYSQILATNKSKAHIAKVRSEGLPTYHLWPEGERPFITTNIYVEPDSAINQRLLGFDMYTDPECRSAMELSRDQNRIVLTRRHTHLHPAIGNTVPAFIMFQPLYQRGSAIGTTEERRANLIGWVHAIFNANSVLDPIPAPFKTKIDIVLYDGEQPSPQARLAGTSPELPDAAPRKGQWAIAAPIEAAGRTWTIKTISRPALETEYALEKANPVLIIGIIASGLLAIVMQLLIRGQEQAFRLARKMNADLVESEYRWKFALEGAGEGVWDWNIASDTIFVGPRLKRLLGYGKHELRTADRQWYLQNIHPEDRQTALNRLRAYLQGQSNEFVVECRMKQKDGDWRWMLARGMIVSHDTASKPTRMIGTLSDVTEDHHKNESLKLASTVFQTMGEAVIVTDVDNRIVSVNPAFTTITGYALEDVIGKDPSILSDGVRRPELSAAMWHALNTHDKWIGENVNRRKSGELYIAWLSINVVRNERGEITNYVSAFSDISERKATEERIQHLAHFDPLTDLPNRALFNDRLRQAIANCRRNRNRLAILFVDLDKFKPVNDNLGHAVGDLLLKEVAYRLMDNIRESDTAARIGGDEFVILLSGIETENDAAMVAHKILSVIREPYHLEPDTIQISASIGIAIYPNHGNTNQILLDHADEAMYLAKRGGGSAVASYGQIQGQDSA